MTATKQMFSTAALTLALVAGCGDGGDAKTQGCPPVPTTGPLYVISTGVLAGDDFLGYLGTVASLDASACFDIEKALEIEPSWIWSKPGEPVLYAAPIFGSTIDRYKLTDDGKLAKDKSVDFANLGLQSAYLAAAAPIYSDEKSYFVDDTQDQMVIWNPKEMTIIGTIPLGNEDEGALPPAAEGSVVVRDGLITTVTYWSDPNEDPSLYGSHVRLIAIDPATDTIVETTDDPRLSYASPQARASDGTLYYSPGSFISAETEVAPGHGSPSHVLRLGPTATAFDAGYDLDLSALVGGRPAGDYTLLDDQNALIRAWHPDLVDLVTAANWKDVLWTQPGFMWWRWHVGDAQAVQIPNQSPGALGSAVVTVEGKTYVVRTGTDAATSTFDEIDAQGEFHPQLNITGQFIGSSGNGLVRLR